MGDRNGGCHQSESQGNLGAVAQAPFPPGSPPLREGLLPVKASDGPCFLFLFGKVAFPYLLYEPPDSQLVKIPGNSTHRCTEKGFASRATATLNPKANYFLCKLPAALQEHSTRSMTVSGYQDSYGNVIPVNVGQKRKT